jgi:phage tail-like protein
MDFEASADVSFSFSASAGLDVSAEIDFGFSAGASMSLGGRRDPYLGFRFAVEIEGLVAGGFSEVDGLQVEIEVQEFREGGMNGFVHKRAGPAKHSSNLTLKRGLAGKTLSDWCWDVVQGTVDRKNVSVLLLDESGDEEVRWNFEQAYPVKWSGPQFRATANEVAMESVELVHRGFARTK